MVTVRILKQSVWDPGSLPERMPPFARDRRYSSAEMEVISWRPAASNQDELLTAGQRLEAFCEGTLTGSATRTETVRLRFTGDTRGTRWEMSDPASPPESPTSERPADRVDACPVWKS